MRTKEVIYKIYLEKTGDDVRGYIEGGYFIWNNSRCNEYIYDRSNDPNNDRIRMYDKHSCAHQMDDMRRLGYACRADPPFTITKSY